MKIFNPKSKIQNLKLAFTLIELLVVVAIIAVLISILLPALNSARNNARTIRCAAQMRGLGQGYIRYSADNNGALMIYSTEKGGASWGWESSLRWRPWSVLMAPYVGVKYSIYIASGGAYFYNFLSPLILDCPSMRTPDYAAAYVSYGMPMYGIGGRSYNSNLLYIRQESQLTEPSRQMIFADSWYQADLTNNADEKGAGWYYVTFPAFNAAPGSGFISFNRHLGIANSIFADGHLEPQTLLELRIPYPDCLNAPPLGISK